MNAKLYGNPLTQTPTNLIEEGHQALAVAVILQALAIKGADYLDSSDAWFWLQIGDIDPDVIRAALTKTDGAIQSKTIKRITT